MSEPITLVCGFGRCGSSLTLQMLAAGGLRCAGAAPTYEPDETRCSKPSSNIIARTWLALQRGAAIKLLDPQRFELPHDEKYRAIWLNRNAREQARSHCKFTAIILGLPVTREHVRLFAKSYGADKPAAIKTLRDARASILELNFEELVSGDAAAIANLAAFCGGLDTAAMSAAIMPRIGGPACQPGLDIEIALINAAEKRPNLGARA